MFTAAFERFVSAYQNNDAAYTLALGDTRPRQLYIHADSQVPRALKHLLQTAIGDDKALFPSSVECNSTAWVYNACNTLSGTPEQTMKKVKDAMRTDILQLQGRYLTEMDGKVKPDLAAETPAMRAAMDANDRELERISELRRASELRAIDRRAQRDEELKRGYVRDEYKP